MFTHSLGSSHQFQLAYSAIMHRLMMQIPVFYYIRFKYKTCSHTYVGPKKHCTARVQVVTIVVPMWQCASLSFVADGPGPHNSKFYRLANVTSARLSKLQTVTGMLRALGSLSCPTIVKSHAAHYMQSRFHLLQSSFVASALLSPSVVNERGGEWVLSKASVFCFREFGLNCELDTDAVALNHGQTD
jgi:hypothetical protein